MEGSIGVWSGTSFHDVVCARVSVVYRRGKSEDKNSFADKREAAGEEDEDEPWREKAAQVFFLFRENPARSHLQVLGEAERTGDD